MPAVELSPDMGAARWPPLPPVRTPTRPCGCRAVVVAGRPGLRQLRPLCLSSSTRLWLKSSKKTRGLDYGERNCRVNATEVRTVYLTTPRVSTTPTTYMLLDAA